MVHVTAHVLLQTSKCSNTPRFPSRHLGVQSSCSSGRTALRQATLCPLSLVLRLSPLGWVRDWASSFTPRYPTVLFLRLRPWEPFVPSFLLRPSAWTGRSWSPALWHRTSCEDLPSPQGEVGRLYTHSHGMCWEEIGVQTRSILFVVRANLS